jgi:1-acyl-sn-glycerol-3-phosphate acyltransferase
MYMKPLLVLQKPLSWNALGGGGWLRLTGASVFYFGTIVFINFLQTLSLVLLPFSRKTFRSVNRWFADLWWGWCVVGAEKIFGLEPVFTGDPIPADENALVFANHQQMPDIIAIMTLAQRKKRLGDMKWFVKHPLKYVPGIGWGMQFLDCIFVKRDWMADRRNIMRTFAKFREENIPIWLITFVEGTRLTEAKLHKSQELSVRRSLERLDHVMVPRTRGFAAALEGLEGHLHAVYDITIGYEKGLPRLHHVFRGKVKRVHIDVRRFPLSSLPKSDEERAGWLQKRFVRKDALMKAFFASNPPAFSP